MTEAEAKTVRVGDMIFSATICLGIVTELNGTDMKIDSPTAGRPMFYRYIEMQSCRVARAVHLFEDEIKALIATRKAIEHLEWCVKRMGK